MRLTPRSSTFYPLFTSFGTHLTAAAALLQQVVEGSEVSREDLAEQAREVEHAADDLTHSIMNAVNATFITPFDREDIYRLAATLDDVVDDIEEAIQLIVLYDVHDAPPDLKEVAGVIAEAAAVTADAMSRLASVTRLTEYWIEINRLENTADQAHRRLLAELFSGRYEPLTVLKLKDVAEAMESAADSFEKVANTVESIAVKES